MESGSSDTRGVLQGTITHALPGAGAKSELCSLSFFTRSLVPGRSGLRDQGIEGLDFTPAICLLQEPSGALDP